MGSLVQAIKALSKQLPFASRHHL